MENSLKAILMGAGVVITLIVVSIGFLLMRSGQSTAQNAISKLGQVNVEMNESQYTMYDGTEVKGDEVVNLLKRFKEEKIGIQVKTKKNTAGKWYIYNGSGDSLIAASGDIKDTMDVTKDEYINLNGKFIGDLKRDTNGTIIAITFTQQ
jgi:hypothetical protein